MQGTDLNGNTINIHSNTEALITGESPSTTSLSFTVETNISHVLDNYYVKVQSNLEKKKRTPVGRHSSPNNTSNIEIE